MEKEDWFYIRDFIKSILVSVQSELDEESVNSVNHYLEYDEFEMAFEGLFIEMMNLKIPPKIDFLKSKEVAKQLKMDEESVFDFEFWRKFEDFISRNTDAI